MDQSGSAFGKRPLVSHSELQRGPAEPNDWTRARIGRRGPNPNFFVNPAPPPLPVTREPLESPESRWDLPQVRELINHEVRERMENFSARANRLTDDLMRTNEQLRHAEDRVMLLEQKLANMTTLVGRLLLESEKRTQLPQPEAKPEPEEDRTCVICMVNMPNALFLHLGEANAHSQFCFGCIEKLVDCPICRQPGRAVKLF